MPCKKAVIGISVQYILAANLADDDDIAFVVRWHELAGGLDVVQVVVGARDLEDDPGIGVVGDGELEGASIGRNGNVIGVDLDDVVGHGELHEKYEFRCRRVPLLW